MYIEYYLKLFRSFALYYLFIIINLADSNLRYNKQKIKINNMVGSNGIEPSTSRLSGVRSNHLSYEPIY